MRIKALAAATAALTLVACSSPTAATSTDEMVALRVQHGLPECPRTDPGATAIPDGLPATELPCLGADQLVNLAGLERKPTIINFWAQWCVPCREEAPFLREGLAEFKGVNFLGINYDDPKPTWAVEFAGVVGWTYPHAVDTQKTLRTSMSVPGLPATYFVAADGTIAGVHAGQLESTDQLRELAQRYLGVS
ncbi:MAG TPA: TlpA family protein disulfide reductase [Tessaracoccus flavescens]|uniref:TlpA family protein disulfide reductase n=1 Tax=Tessaracoccus flavescens TaxID=399497 RepID=A0A921JR42_9ACTN|nr:TlpA family protein disulfide reductase [Tessaracoccus flavescens]